LPYGDGVSFWAIGEIVKAHAGILDSDDLATVEERLRAVLPEGEDGSWVGERLRPLLALEATHASREENFAAWRLFLAHIAARGPTVLVLEDLHWADAEMRAFVQSLSGQRLGAPVLVIGTTRPELLERQPDFLDDRPPADCITLLSLERSDVAGLATVMLGGEPDDVTADSILARSGGNPLFVEEYVRLLAGRDLLRNTPRGIEIVGEVDSPSFPDSLQGVIGARLDLLSPTLRSALAGAAVLGESFWRGAVAAVAGVDDSAVEDAMRELEAQHLVRAVVQSSFAGQAEYVFWHALVRDVAYARLPRKVRVLKHVAAAQWVEGTAGDRTRELAEVLAYHYATAFELAAASNDSAAAVLRVQAAHYLTLAAERTAPLDGGAAERYYTRAIDIAPEPTVERFRLVARRAAIAALRGRASSAAADFEMAIAGFREAGDTRAAAAAMNGLTDVLMTLGDLRFHDASAAALELAESDGASSVMVDVLLDRAALVLDEEGPRQALEAVEQALAIAKSIGMPPPATALGLRGGVRCALGDAAGLEDIRRAIRAAEHEGRRVDQAGLLLELSWSLVSFEGPAASLQALDASAEVARRSHLEGLVASARGMAVRSLYWAGEWDAALAECRELAPILDGMGDAWGLAVVRYVWSLLLLGRGDASRAEPLAALALEVARDNPIRGVSAVYLVASAAARHGIGDDGAAFALLEECRKTLRGQGDTVFVYLLPLAVRTALAAGNEDLARSLAEGVVPLLPFGRHVDATLRAQDCEIEGELAQAAAGFTAAAAGWHDFGVPYEEGHALLGHGRCLVALGRAPEAAAPLAAAREIFARLGAKPALAETDALLTQVGASGSA
jgi:tetratricopeptide (TPR) repeat protein